ncbi:hypothetical protein TNCV_4599681 [Trichonephila clavipes]|nr:hypothetical protein TNCV_4599681 [Trichonephila clavipes]
MTYVKPLILVLSMIQFLPSHANLLKNAKKLFQLQCWVRTAFEGCRQSFPPSLEGDLLHCQVRPLRRNVLRRFLNREIFLQKIPVSGVNTAM